MKKLSILTKTFQIQKTILNNKKEKTKNICREKIQIFLRSGTLRFKKNKKTTILHSIITNGDTPPYTVQPKNEIKKTT